jgi:phosphoglycerol transferase MdoB-like AlkP superfamily enzyme
MAIWSLLECPLLTLALGAVLTFAAFALLRDYRRLFMTDPKSVMSAEVLVQAVTNSGGPGYLAAFLLAAAALCLVSALFSLVFNVSSYLGA